MTDLVGIEGARCDEHLLGVFGEVLDDLVSALFDPSPSRIQDAGVDLFDVDEAVAGAELLESPGPRRDREYRVACTGSHGETRPVLVMMDLDNTLADRHTAVSAWADEFCGHHASPAGTREWILEQDQEA
ncbi:MAG: hypothetical protein GY929_19680 [Actinomycetia bacterium]|nr:hypothetical protein [Actinomycetes bacterium]